MKAVIIIAISLMSMGFVNENKLTKDVEKLCSKTWTPIKQGRPDTIVKVNYFPNHVYEITFAYGGQTGDTFSGSWTINNEGNICLEVYGIEAVIYLLEVNEETLTLRMEDNKTVTYCSN